jgi:hypothetical protein
MPENKKFLKFKALAIAPVRSRTVPICIQACFFLAAEVRATLFRKTSYENFENVP